MKYNIVKLDRRMSGHTLYRYRIDVLSRDWAESYQYLCDLRNWLWSTYGPSSELEAPSRNINWCWDTEYKNKRIYIKDDEILVMFKLKFS